MKTIVLEEKEFIEKLLEVMSQFPPFDESVKRGDWTKDNFPTFLKTDRFVGSDGTVFIKKGSEMVEAI
jgi:hypothetical protein